MASRSESYKYVFATPLTRINYKNPAIIQKMEKFNPSLLLYHYRSQNNKTQAITLLLSLKLKNKILRISEEIVYTYIYFKDYKGALDYLRHYEFTNSRLKYIENMINIHQLNPKTHEMLYDLMYACLKSKFVKSVIEIFLNFYKLEYKNDFESALKQSLTDLSTLFTESYLSKISYADAKFLYKVMPCKAKFLKRMVKANPYIKRKYYFEYAKAFGIDKTDIVCILSTVYRDWAFRIAFDKKWIVKSMRPVIEKAMMSRPLVINKAGKWVHKTDGTGIMFLKHDSMGRI